MTTVEAAVAAVREEPADLVLVHAVALADTVPKNGGGWGTAASGSSTGLLVFGDRAEELKASIADGVRDFLLPPFDPELVRIRIEAVLERVRSRDQLADDAKREELLKLERDLQIGRTIQAGFLPTTLPRADGWELTAFFRPAREVAGDFYDAFYMVNQRRIGFVIADVCDKGVGAALFMSLFRTLVRSNAQHNTSLGWMDAGSGSIADDKDWLKGGPAQRRQSLPNIGTGALMNAVVGTNDYITENHMEQGYFATMFFGVLDPSNGALVYINGGHNPPVLHRADGTQVYLKPTGPAVGMLPGVKFKMGQAKLEPGDVLFAYTDGVTDARSPRRGVLHRAPPVRRRGCRGPHRAGARRRRRLAAHRAHRRGAAVRRHHDAGRAAGTRGPGHRVDRGSAAEGARRPSERWGMSRIISVHSFRGGTGKSNTSANLGALMAQGGLRVGVVDTDIQSPGIHVLFGLDQAHIEHSLNDYLWGKCDIEQAAHDVTGQPPRRHPRQGLPDPVEHQGRRDRADHPRGLRRRAPQRRLPAARVRAPARRAPDRHAPGRGRGDAPVDRHLGRAGHPHAARPPGLPGHRRDGRDRAQARRSAHGAAGEQVPALVLQRGRQAAGGDHLQLRGRGGGAALGRDDDARQPGRLRGRVPRQPDHEAVPAGRAGTAPVTRAGPVG
jgi:hypothetical protein